MALTTCPKCGEKVSTNAEKCVHCGTDLITKTSVENNIEIEKNVAWHLKYANSIMGSAIFVALVFVVLAIVLLEATEGFSLFFLIGAVLIICWGVFYSKAFEWKAYMLQSIYELNKKTK